MREYRKGSDSVYDINYHFVWITKHRYPVLRGDLATRVRDIVREVTDVVLTPPPNLRKRHHPFWC